MKSTEQHCRSNALSKTCNSGSGCPLRTITNHLPSKRRKATGNDFLNMEHAISPNAPSKCFKKFKLQLFPIDEFTRKGLEKDKFNPFLELTIGVRKKISSVVSHIDAKWGMSDIASGELLLFPYIFRPEDLGCSKRWSLKDSSVTAAEVHAAIGSPTVFRLSYGWFSDPNIKITHISSENKCLEGNLNKYTATRNKISNPMSILNKDPQEIDACNKNEHQGVLPYQRNQSFPSCDFVKQNVDKMDVPNKSDHVKVTNSISCLWPDLSNLSFGALLNCTLNTRSTTFQQSGMNCDSFDDAIDAHFNRFCGTDLQQPAQVSWPSILDAEETCHIVPFRNANSRKEASASSTVPTTLNQHDPSDAMAVHDKIIITDTYSKPAAAMECKDDVDDSCFFGAVNSQKASTIGSLNISNDLGKIDFASFDSLGPWAGTRQTGDDTSISRLLGSLDAFQNCSRH